MKPHRLIIIALLVVGVAFVAAAPGVKAQETCDNPSLVETTLPWPPEIHRAVSRALCRRPGAMLPGAYPNLILTSLDLFEGETWLFATVVMRPDPPPFTFNSQITPVIYPRYTKPISRLLRPAAGLSICP